MIKFSGPVFATVDNRLMSLQLVENSLTDAAMFTAVGEVVQPSEVLYGKPVLIERGSFRPVTNVTLDMIARAQKQLRRGHAPHRATNRVVLMEMTLNNLMSAQTIDHQDFLEPRRSAGSARQDRDDFQLHALRWRHRIPAKIHQEHGSPW